MGEERAIQLGPTAALFCIATVGALAFVVGRLTAGAEDPPDHHHADQPTEQAWDAALGLGGHDVEDSEPNDEAVLPNGPDGVAPLPSTLHAEKDVSKQPLVVHHEAIVYAEPKKAFDEVLVLQPGMSARTVDQRDGWTRVAVKRTNQEPLYGWVVVPVSPASGGTVVGKVSFVVTCPRNRSLQHHPMWKRPEIESRASAHFEAVLAMLATCHVPLTCG